MALRDLAFLQAMTFVSTCDMPSCFELSSIQPFSISQENSSDFKLIRYISSSF